MVKAKPAAGVLRKGSVFVDDASDANRLHNATSTGQPQPGNGLKLSLVEAAWACANGRLQVLLDDAAAGPAQILAASPALVPAFLVYCDLRDRGLTARETKDGLAVWPRVATPDGTPEYHVVPATGDASVTGKELAAWATRRTVVGLVDGDGAVTHYRLALEEPRGDLAAARLLPTEGQALGDGVLVADADAARALHEGSRLGTPGPAGLLLSRLEAAALAREGVLRTPTNGGAADPTLQAFLALRAGGVTARSGFRFGTDLRAYRGDPDATHADWLVQCAKPSDGLQWRDLSRGVRLAHGVRKTFLLAVGGKEVQFVALTWFRP